jgi:hypothetical protein
LTTSSTRSASRSTRPRGADGAPVGIRSGSCPCPTLTDTSEAAQTGLGASNWNIRIVDQRVTPHEASQDWIHTPPTLHVASTDVQRHVSSTSSVRRDRGRYLNRHRGSASRANASSAVIASAR